MILGLGAGIPMPSGVGATMDGPFSPLDLSPVLWLDAADTSTITEVGGAVSQWDDKSGNGYHLTQGTAAAQPTTGTRTINGLNVLDFDGSDKLSSSTFASSLSIRTIFGVAVTDATDTIRYFIDGTGAGYTRVGISGATYRIYGGIGENGGTSDTSAHVYRAVFDTTDTLHIDGVSTISGDAGSATMTAAQVGGPDAAPWNGTVAEVIVVAGTLTAGEIAATETYLAAKWNVTL